MSSHVSSDDTGSAPAEAVVGGDRSVGDRPVEDRLDRVRFLGLPLVDAPSLDPVIAQVLAGVPPPDGLLPLVLTPNVDIAVHLHANPATVEADLFGRAQYCLPDGQPIVAASRLLRRPLAARLAGSDLFTLLWPRLVTEQVPVVVVASSDAVADALADDDPRAEFVVPPMFDAADDAAIAAIVDEVVAAAARVRPRIVLFGVGNPKDARLMGALLDRWDPDLGDVPLAMGLGASFALHLGLTRRAPRWLQRLGLEWFHRFLQEPRRLFRRYFVDDLAFLPLVWRELRANGLGRGRGRG